MSRWDNKARGLNIPHTADETWDFRPAWEAGYRFFVVQLNLQAGDRNWEYTYNPNLAGVVEKIYRDTNGGAVIIGLHNINLHWISTSGASLAQWQDNGFQVATDYPEQAVLLSQVKNKWMQGLIFNYSKWWLTWPIDFSKLVPGIWGSAALIKTMEQYLANAQAVNPRIKAAYPMYWRYLIDGCGELEHSVAGGTLYTSNWEEAVDYASAIGTHDYDAAGWDVLWPDQVTWPNGEDHNWPPLSAQALSYFIAGYLQNAPGLSETVGIVTSEYTEAQLFAQYDLPVPTVVPVEPDPEPTPEPEPEPTPDPEPAAYTLGCDISHWQDDLTTPEVVNFETMKDAGAEFVFLKASQGTWTDSTFKQHWAASKAAGLLRGAYHFLSYEIDPRVQAEYFWSLIKDDPGELPPVADYEYWGDPPNDAIDYLWGFVDTLERLSGKTPIIYTGAFFWNSTDPGAWANFPLWIASYSSQEYMQANIASRMPWSDWRFWQFTERGNGEKYGVESKQIDLNYFNGSREQLIAYADTAEEPVTELTLAEKVERLWAAHPELHA